MVIQTIDVSPEPRYSIVINRAIKFIIPGYLNNSILLQISQICILYVFISY